MKTLLIQPPSVDPLTDQIFMFEPLALEYLGAGLELDGHQVEILDSRLTPDIESACRRFQPQVVGLTGYTFQANIVKEIADRIASTELFQRVVQAAGMCAHLSRLHGPLQLLCALVHHWRQVPESHSGSSGGGIENRCRTQCVLLRRRIDVRRSAHGPPGGPDPRVRHPKEVL